MKNNVKIVQNIRIIRLTVYLCCPLLQLPGHLLGGGGQLLPELLEAPVSQPPLHAGAAAARTGRAELQARL